MINRKVTLTSFIFLFAIVQVIAQTPVYNGGFENWTKTDSLSTPVNWGINDTLFGGRVNRFVFKDSLPENVSAGSYSIKLRSNTITVLNVDQAPGVITYGNIYIPGMGGSPASAGLPFTGHPSAIGFAIKIDHSLSVTDTAYWDYRLTRWNSITMKEDSLAYGGSQFFDSLVPMNQWFWVSDSIRYLLPGQPDTLHIVFLGGGANNALRRGNTVWLDDVSLFYTGTGLVHLDIDDAIHVFPNPAKEVLNVKADDYMKGYTMLIYDINSRLVSESILTNSMNPINIANLPAGNYLYKVKDLKEEMISKGKFEIVK